ncbi:MAG: MBL fold metallo-hydrolase, partial [Candidatus Limnocylindrales bacterium]
MRLTVLGAGPAYTDRDGATGACYLVSEADTHLLLDLGQGSFTRIFHHVPPTDLAAVVVSHLHPDHFIDLVAMRHFLRYEFDPPRRMRVIAP